MNADSSLPSEPRHAPVLCGSPSMSQAKIDNYHSVRGAQAYYDDHQTKLHRRYSDRRERQILTRFLGRVERGGRLLDAPCGFGRLFEVLSEHADAVVESDFSPTMLQLNRSLHGGRAAAYLECSALEVPRPDRYFDTVVSVRLNHHLETERDREAHIRELCRLSDNAVVFTYFSRSSLKNRLRQLRSLWSKKRPKHTLTREQVRAVLAESGFATVAQRPLSRLGSGHVYVLARRVGRRIRV